MITIKSSYEIQYFTDSQIEFLELNSSKKRLFEVIADHLKKHQIDEITIDLSRNSLTCKSSILFEHDNYFWIVAENSNGLLKCRGIFYSISNAVNFFVFELLNPYPRTIDWDALLQDESYVAQVKAIRKSEYFVITSRFSFKWLRIESDFPPEFFKTYNDAFDLLGYVDGQKFIYETLKRFMGDAADSIIEYKKRCGYCDIALGEMGKSFADYTICEADGYWLVTAGERGSVFFGSLFCSYRDAVDCYIICSGFTSNKIDLKEIPWEDVHSSQDHGKDV